MSDTNAKIHEKIIAFLNQNSTLDDGYPSNWREVLGHLNECGLDFPKCTYTDGDWWDGAGTFSEGYEVKGIASKVTCKCGRVTDCHQRYTGSYVELIQGITAEDK